MNKNDVGSAALGAIFSMGIGSVMLQGLGALIVGILGALGGWFFAHFLRPQLDKIFRKVLLKK